jgi:hypothetical protein
MVNVAVQASPSIAALLADVDGTVVTKDKVISEQIFGFLAVHLESALDGPEGRKKACKLLFLTR